MIIQLNSNPQTHPLIFLSYNWVPTIQYHRIPGAYTSWTCAICCIRWIKTLSPNYTCDFDKREQSTLRTCSMSTDPLVNANARTHTLIDMNQTLRFARKLCSFELKHNLKSFGFKEMGKPIQPRINGRACSIRVYRVESHRIRAWMERIHKK